MDIQNKSGSGRQRLSVGIDRFTEICDGDYYYVDKTLLIKKIIDYRAKAVLFTRPRRFGKSLNMDMLRTFFEISDEDTARYFADKKIWTQGAEYTDLQGHYPVVSLSFLGMSAPSWDDMLFDLGRVIQNEFLRQSSFLNMERLNRPLQKRFEAVAYGEPTRNELRCSLVDLTRILHQAHGVAPIILIDEYDAPIEHAWAKGYYDEAIEFMRGFLTPALKSNPDLSFACLTGVLRVARESIFSGLNNLEVDGVLSEAYDEFFGFTPEEVREMARAYNVEDKFEEISYWYEGYRFGNQEVFNPWSVINYFKSGYKPQAYWANTSTSDVIGHILQRAEPDVLDGLMRLLGGKPLRCAVRPTLTYPDVDAAEHGRGTAESVFTLLLMSGYLTPTGETLQDNANVIELTVPNRELQEIYRERVQRWLYGTVVRGEEMTSRLCEALKAGDEAGAETALREILERSSFHDLTDEQCYHLVLEGILMASIPDYVLFSNREAGDGRFDICLEPKDRSMAGIIIELKHEKARTEDNLEDLAKEGLKQIWDKDYAADLRALDIPEVQAFGMAFSGKRVKVAAEKRSLHRQ